MEKNALMKYVTLGRSGLKVSKFSFGNWVNSNDEAEAQKSANELVKAAWENGINYFDTAEAYDSGKGERQFGIAIAELEVPRSDYVVSTKLFWGRFDENNNFVNNFGTSRKRLIEGLNRSLANLKMEYVDILFCHRYDEETPTIEVVQTMKSIIDSGKALYWGTSTWPAIRVMEAMLLCDIVGCPRPIAEQCQYSMLTRDAIEKDYVPLFDDYDLGTTIWSPLASGVLTGKYNEGIPEGSRFANHEKYLFIFKKYFGDQSKEKTLESLNGLSTIAAKVGCSLAQLALAWTLLSKDVTTCILGATSVKQLEENLKALEFLDKITPEILAEIEKVLDNRPSLGMDYRNRCDIANRR
jgi:voltage-dependent potassium channel beta subunit